jgi:curved DNA-binding protein CbpA
LEGVSRDPYKVLGVEPGVSSEELHDTYRRLVKLHHPDRNGGSADSTRRFQEIQQAYEEVRTRRAARPRPRPAAPPPSPGDPAVESRMADLERELREAQAARDRARQAARDAVRDATGRPSDEELGYVTTDDSFTKILADVRTEVSDRLSEARQHPAVKRVADIVEGLEGLTSRFDKR